MKVEHSGAAGNLTPIPEAFARALADRYVLERRLGAGGMATVYLARDVRHDRHVAVKVLHPELGMVLGGERFLSEIRTTARLQHPHILPLLDSGATDGLLYYVMPYVAGETLRARLDAERQLPVDDAVRIAREVASALDYAHRQGVIHRDVKPENILLHEGQALVADFGIALAVQSAGGERMTQTGLSLGTPQYMSPEQAMGERTIDARSDVYALGAVTYEMLAGEPPFTGPTIHVIVAQLMADDPRPLTAQRRSVPEHVDAAVMRALEKIPADRPASAAEFATALETPGHLGPDPRRRLQASGARGARGPRALAPMLWAVFTRVVPVLLLVGVAAWGWLRPAPRPEVVRYRIVIDSVPAMKDWSGEIAISPDGSILVRSGGPSGTLLVRRRDELAFSPLPGTEGASGPFFSPDGTRVGFYANGALLAVPVGGGPPVTIADSVPTPEPISWGTDGYLYRSRLQNRGEVVVRSEARRGAPVEVLTQVDTAAGELTHLHVEALPDGRGAIFQVSYLDGRRALAVVAPGARRHTPLLEGVRARYARSGHLVYTTDDGKLWAVPFDLKRLTTSGSAVQVGERIPATIVGPIDFAVSASGTLAYSMEDVGGRRELTWVARDGTRAPFDAAWKAEFSNPTLSPDGSLLAVAIRTGAQSDVWVKPVSGAAAYRLTTQHRSNVEPSWSPDGRWVSFIAGAGGANTGDVWRQRPDGSARAERVLQSARPLSEQTWAPGSGALLVRTTTPTVGAGDILLMRPGIDSVARPFITSPHAEYTPAVSPDGRWVAYVSNYSGRLEVYVSPFDAPGSARWVVSTAGGSTPRWSPRGDELFFLDQRSNLVSARVTTAPTFAVQETRVLFDARDFVQTSSSRRSFDVAPDGRRFLMVQRADGAKRGQVIVVENWAEEMRRKAAGR